jgi:hypothetical protein
VGKSHHPVSGWIIEDIRAHRIKISNRRATQRCNASSFFMQKFAVYWPEGGAASQYSVFIGQKMLLTG